MSGFWQTTTNQDQRGSTLNTETVQIPLSRSNFLSEVELRLSNTNGATSNVVATGVNNTVIDAVQRIEVLGNGNDIKNYRGYECVKWAQYLRKTKPAMSETQAAAGVQFQSFPILFGRFTGDEYCMLPAKLFRTLVLKWTNVFPVHASTGYATGSAKADVVEVEWVSGDDPTKKIILKETETETFTAGTSGERKSPASGLPLGNKITKVLIHDYLAGHDSEYGITYARLGINNYSETPVGKTAWHSIAEMNKYQRGIESDRKSLSAFVANTNVNNTRISNINAAIATSGVAGTHAASTTVAGDQVTVGLYDLATPTAISSAEGVWLEAVSKDALSYAIVIDLDPLDSIVAGGIDTSSGVNEVELGLTQAAATTVYISTQEAVVPSA